MESRDIRKTALSDSLITRFELLMRGLIGSRDRRRNAGSRRKR